MSDYPLTWKPVDFKPPERSSWSISFTPASLQNERFRRKIERKRPGTRWDTQNITDNNVDCYWWLGSPHPDFPKYLYHLRRAEARRLFPKIDKAKENLDPERSYSFLKEEYVRLCGEAVISLQRREGPFAPAEILWDMPEQAEANAIWDEMEKRTKEPESL